MVGAVKCAGGCGGPAQRNPNAPFMAFVTCGRAECRVLSALEADLNRPPAVQGQDLLPPGPVRPPKELPTSWYPMWLRALEVVVLIAMVGELVVQYVWGHPTYTQAFYATGVVLVLWSIKFRYRWRARNRRVPAHGPVRKWGTTGQLRWCVYHETPHPPGQSCPTDL